MKTKKPPKSEKYVVAAYLHAPIDEICEPVVPNPTPNPTEIDNKSKILEIKLMDDPSIHYPECIVDVISYDQNNGAYLPAWPLDGDRRVALLTCLMGRIIRRSGEWHHIRTLADRMAATIQLQDDITVLGRFVGDDDPGYLRVGLERARGLFVNGLSDLGLDVRLLSEIQINKYWGIAQRLDWGRDMINSPVVSWLRTTCEVSSETRSAAVSTSELIAQWRIDHRDDARAGIWIAREVAEGIAECWPNEIKNKYLRYDKNIRWTNKSGRCSHARGWLGMVLTDVERLHGREEELAHATNYVRRSGLTIASLLKK